MAVCAERAAGVGDVAAGRSPAFSDGRVHALGSTEVSAKQGSSVNKRKRVIVVLYAGAGRRYKARYSPTSKPASPSIAGLTR